MSDVISPAAASRASPGRSDEATRHLIAEAARGAFIACGCSAANMDCVGEECGGLEEDALPRFPTKAELFGASIADGIDSFILALDQGKRRTAAGARFGAHPDRVRTLALAEDTTAIQKLVLAESGRFPELAADFYRGAVIATQRVFMRCLERLCHQGAIEIKDWMKRQACCAA